MLMTPEDPPMSELALNSRSPSGSARATATIR